MIFVHVELWVILGIMSGKLGRLAIHMTMVHVHLMLLLVSLLHLRGKIHVLLVHISCVRFCMETYGVVHLLDLRSNLVLWIVLRWILLLLRE